MPADGGVADASGTFVASVASPGSGRVADSGVASGGALGSGSGSGFVWAVVPGISSEPGVSGATGISGAGARGVGAGIGGAKYSGTVETGWSTARWAYRVADCRVAGSSSSPMINT